MDSPTVKIPYRRKLIELADSPVRPGILAIGIPLGAFADGALQVIGGVFCVIGIILTCAWWLPEDEG